MAFFIILLNVPYTYREFLFALGNFPYTRVFPYAGMGKIIHKLENFPLHVWVNNFQYSMKNFQTFVKQ